jgi:DNA-binding beta-propeller fold protein YncE
MRKLLIALLIATLPTIALGELVVGEAVGGYLAILDPASGGLTEYASLGTPSIMSLAYDPLTEKAYCSDTSEGVNQILELDPDTGATTLVVQVQDFYTTIHALAVHPTTGVLYAIDNYNAILYRVDTIAGELVHIGGLGVYWMSGADFDPETGELYGCIGGMDSTGGLYTIDIETGAATQVATTERLMGIAFDEDGQLYGVDNMWWPDDTGIYRIDKMTGEAEVIGIYPDNNFMSIESIPLNVVRNESMSFSDVKALFQ